MTSSKLIDLRKDFHFIPVDTDIVLHCDDYMGDYMVQGQIKIKNNGKCKPVKKFCRLVDGKWESDFKNWQQRSYWELAEIESKLGGLNDK